MNGLKIKNHKSKVWTLLWLVIFGLALVWRAQNLDAFGLSNDEGAHLMWARLAVDGYSLYGETQAVQAPLFLEWVGLAFRLAGHTVQAGRWAMLTGFGLLAVALSWLAHRAGGWPAALAALILLGISPLIFTFSRLVMAEVPATALAVVSVALVFLYLDERHKRWLLASGLALGLSFTTKALNPFVAVPVGLLLWVHCRDAGQDVVRPRRWQRLLLDGSLWTAGVGIPLAATLLIYEPAAVYDQLVAFRGDLRAAIPGSWPETWAQFANFLETHWGFWLLAFGGIMATVLRRRTQSAGKNSEEQERESAETKEQKSREVEERSQGEISLFGLSPRTKPAPLPPWTPAIYPLTWSTWLIAGTAMLAWHAPLFPHHFVVLLPPLILLGAGFVADVITFWTGRNPAGQRRQFQRVGVTTGQFRADTEGVPSVRKLAGSCGLAAVLSMVMVAAAFNVPAMARANQKTAAIATGGREAEAIDLLKAVSGSDDFIMGDSQLLIFMAGRRTPPPLGDVALVAIKAGRQTSARMIGLTKEYQAPAVVQWSLRLPWLPQYLAWVEANYLARRVWDNDHIIYFAPRFQAGQPVPHQHKVSLGNALTWRGYQIDKTTAAAGQSLNLKVYWETGAPLARDYTIFTQLLDSRGLLAAGRDSQPLGGYFPTSRWPVNEIITDVVQLALPPDLPGGEYTLITGLYLLDTLERLQTPEGADHVVLTTIKIE